MRFTREEIRTRLKQSLESGESILVYGAGSGLSAKAAEDGGADIISIYSTAIVRMQGAESILSSLPYMDCNALTLEVAEKALPLVKKTPCIAGVGAHDPRLDIDLLLERFTCLGFSGISNEPFAGSYGTHFAALMEESGCGFTKEAELIARARRRDLFTLAWCMSAEEAGAMCNAGADMIGAMVMYGPKKDNIRTSKQAFEESLGTVEDICAAVRKTSADIFIICHGSPFHSPETAAACIKRTHVHGHACGSGGERISAAAAMTVAARQYKAIDYTKEEKNEQAHCDWL